jgi:hypothetical protein
VPVREAVLTVLRNTGCSRAQAAAHVEVSRETFGRWMSANASFRDAVEKAENEYDLGLLARARSHATRDSRTATWLIEHHPRLRAEWSQKAEVGVTVSGPDGGPPKLEVEHTHGLASGTGEQLAQLVEFAATADVLVRVGLIPPPGEHLISDGEAESVVDAEVDEVHPA